MAGTDFQGEPISCNISRKEDDSDDITVALTDSTGAAATVVGWTAELNIGASKDGTPLATFSGVGIAGGLIPIDMATFALTPGSYFYDIRITDTVTPDTPARVYFEGKFKVVDRVKT